MQISYLDGPRLRRSLIAACEYAETQRRELNRINFFPVPEHGDEPGFDRPGQITSAATTSDLSRVWLTTRPRGRSSALGATAG